MDIAEQDSCSGVKRDSAIQLIYSCIANRTEREEWLSELESAADSDLAEIIESLSDSALLDTF